MRARRQIAASFPDPPKNLGGTLAVRSLGFRQAVEEWARQYLSSGGSGSATSQPAPIGSFRSEGLVRVHRRVLRLVYHHRLSYFTVQPAGWTISWRGVEFDVVKIVLSFLPQSEPVPRPLDSCTRRILAEACKRSSTQAFWALGIVVGRTIHHSPLTQGTGSSN